jgi:predicted alpha/beta-fold hydrolase
MMLLPHSVFFLVLATGSIAYAPVILSRSLTSSITMDERSKLVSYQEEAGKIVASYQPSSFNPVPWLSNCHLQTIGGVFLREDCAYVQEENIIPTLLATLAKKVSTPTQQNYWNRRERIATPDGDFFHVDYKDQPVQSKGLMILIHGLESNSESPLILDMARAYFALGLDVCCISFRGCSGEPNLTLGAYHLGFTDDLLQYLEVVRTRFEEDLPPIYLSGFSLGGNMMIKALGELKQDARDVYNIRGAAVFCIPFDAERSYTRLMEPGINKRIYTGSLLKSMKEKARVQFERLCDGDINTNKFDFPGVMRAETIFDVENAWIAPIYGFADAFDYFRQTKSVRFMPHVAVATLILNSVDDPFMDGTHQPLEVTLEHGGPAPIKMVFEKSGGHCGFLFHQLCEGERTPTVSWASAEMARFIQHIMNSDIVQNE